MYIRIDSVRACLALFTCSVVCLFVSYWTYHRWSTPSAFTADEVNEILTDVIENQTEKKQSDTPLSSNSASNNSDTKSRFFQYKKNREALQALTDNEVIALMNESYNGAKLKVLNKSARVLFSRACQHLDLKTAEIELFEYKKGFTEIVDWGWNRIQLAATYEYKNSFELYIDMLTNLYLLKHFNGYQHIDDRQKFMAELFALETVGEAIGHQFFKNILRKNWRPEFLSVTILKQIARKEDKLDHLFDYFSDYPGDRGLLAAHMFYCIKPAPIEIGGEKKYNKLLGILKSRLKLAVKRTKTYIQLLEHLDKYFTESHVQAAFSN